MSADSIEQLQRKFSRAQEIWNDGEIAALRVKLRDALARRAREESARGIFRCINCRENFVDPSAGEDTCAECLREI